MKNIKLLIILIVFFSIAFQFESCKNEPVGLDALDTVCFNTQVLPTFTSSCALSRCHDSISHKSRFNATSYSSIIKYVTPGNAWKSKIYTIVSSPDNPDMMPPSPHTPLTLQQRTFIEVWIEQGAKDTRCSSSTTPVDTSNTTGSKCDTTGTISFANQVMPVISSNCIICHGSDYNSTGGGYNLSNYSAIEHIASTQLSNISLLIGVINGNNDFPSMPKSGAKLSLCNTRTIELWVQQGTLNN